MKVTDLAIYKKMFGGGGNSGDEPSVAKYDANGYRPITELTAKDLEGVTKIGHSAFYGCNSLESIDIPDSVTSVGTNVFYGCRNLESVKIPDSVTSIDSYAFGGCLKIKALYISSIESWCKTTVGVDALPFYYSQVKERNLYVNGEKVTDIIIPDSVTSITGHIFEKCTSIASVIIPDSVTSIGSSAFKECANLASVIIPDSVTSIGSSAFQATAISNIVIPDSVTSIGSTAFYKCTSLIRLTIKAETPPTIQSNTFTQVPAECAIYVPAASVDAYKAATNWSARADYIFPIEE